MKILYCAHGDNYHIKNWIRALVRRGAEIHLAGFQQPDDSALPARFHPLPTVTGTLRYWDFYIAASDLQQIINRIQPDLIFASFANTYGMMAALSGFRPYVVQTWSRDIGIKAMQSRREWLQNRLTGFPVLAAADGITTDGLAYRDRLLRQKPEWTPKTLGTPWGIKQSEFEISREETSSAKAAFGIPEEASVISGVRGVYWYYQPEAVINGIREAVEQDENRYGLILSLHQQRSQTIQKLLNDVSGHPRMSVIDRLLDTPEMKRIWAMTDIFVSTPIDDGVSEAVSEGRYAGAIPVLNPIPSNLERARPDTHAVYTPSERPDAGQIAGAIEQALDLSGGIKGEMQQANRTWVEQHASVEGTTDRLYRFFEAIVDQYRSGR